MVIVVVPNSWSCGTPSKWRNDSWFIKVIRSPRIRGPVLGGYPSSKKNPSNMDLGALIAFADTHGILHKHLRTPTTIRRWKFWGKNAFFWKQESDDEVTWFFQEF